MYHNNMERRSRKLRLQPMEEQLKSRLYKNFSQEELARYRHSAARRGEESEEKDQSLTLTRAESTKILVPRITLKSKIDVSAISSLPYRIDNGKFIVRRNQAADLNNTMAEDQKFHRMDSQGSILAEIKKEEPMRRVSRKGLQKLISTKEKKTAEQYIAEIKASVPKRKDERNQFSYLQIRNDPYDLRIVNFERSNNPNGYITISKRGITFFNKEESSFVGLDEWLKEAELYRKLVNLSFFKKYKIWKNFSIWRRYIRKNYMSQVKASLEEELFITDVQLCPSLLEARRLSFMICTDIKYYRADNLKETKRYLDFKDEQDYYRFSELDTNTNAIEDLIKKQVVDDCKTSLNEFKKKNRIASEDSLESEEAQPFLLGDETNKEMPYTQEATIKTHFKRLRKFIKLTDYLIAEGKLKMIQHSTESLKNQIERMNDAVSDAQEDHKPYRGDTWLFCEINYNDRGDLEYLPNYDTLKGMFQQLVSKGVTRICKKHKSLLSTPELQVYNEKGEIDPKNEEIKVVPGAELQGILYNDEKFKLSYDRLFSEIERAFRLSERYGETLRPFIAIFFSNSTFELNAIEQMETEEIEALIERWKVENSQLQSFPAENEQGLLFCQNKTLKEKIKGCAQQCLSHTYNRLPNMLLNRSKTLCDQLAESNIKLGIEPKSVQQFLQFSKNLNEFTARLDFLSEQVSELGKLDILINKNKPFMVEPSEHLKQKSKKYLESQQLLSNLREKIDQANMYMEQYHQKFSREVENRIPHLNKDISQACSEIETFPCHSEPDIAKVLAFLDRVGESTSRLKEKCEQLNFYQKSLGLEETVFSELADLLQNHSNLHSLYLLISQIETYQAKLSETHFKQVSAKEDIQMIELSLKKNTVLLKSFELKPDFKRAEANDRKIRELLDTLQTIRNLNSECLTEAYWDQICLKLMKELGVIDEGEGVQILRNREDPRWKVELLRELGIFKYGEYFEDIAVRARKEAELVAMLKSVKDFWVKTYINIVPFKDKADILILGNNEELLSKMDDCMMTISNILASRYVDIIRDQVERQQKLFKALQELLDEWKVHQRNWLYLEPIFNSAYSNKNLPKESKAFSVADNNWKKQMKLNKDATAEKWANNDQALSILKANNQTYETIQKVLDQFLEKKRQVFQRFFFLSNDQILQILSQVKELKALQPYLRKCFENIVRFHYDDSKSETITGLVSAQGEVLVLGSGGAYSFRGPTVEEWLNNINDNMRGCLKKTIRASQQVYENESGSRKDWIMSWPSQAVLTVDAYVWTKIVEHDYLAAQSDGDLGDFLQSQISQLSEICEVIRTNLTDLQRRTLVALITQDVHFRDIVEQLKNDGVQSYQDFKWQQQLKFYMNQNDNLVYCQQVNSTLAYGYEYLGATSRLVITPLTDRCWMTITGALGIRLGAAPQGPAGTGKTESCKDLAKALGRFCIVFNCSDQINVKMMEKLFIGLSFTGAWICLDEFNRIDIEVLSVVAQQVQLIREALLQSKSSFNFLGKQITLNPELGIFITMNPGYAGRTELPENLKVLFRPVAMMVPDYSLIAEIMLFAEGFDNAKELSVKMSKLYKLSSEQLSQQDHYDFGMRAVKSVLVMAGAFKRAEPKLSEDIVLIMAMRDSNLPKFLSFDIPLFNAILKDLFPSCVLPSLVNLELENTFQAVLAEANLASVPALLNKLLQLHETLKVRFGAMVVGETMSGKTTCLKVLQQTYSRLKDVYAQKGVLDHPHFQFVNSKIINPKAISIEQLYGRFDTMTQSWSDGLASSVMRSYVSAEGNDKHWVIFDGPVDALWVQNMNTVLDDSMTLCLANGQRIKLKPSLKILFQVLNLSQASPATVSRCGMVYLDDNILNSRALVESYFTSRIANFFKSKPESLNTFINSVANYLQKLLPQFKKGLRQYAFVKCTALNLVVSVCRTIEVLLAKADPSTFFVHEKKNLDRLSSWALSWGCGSHINEKGRQKLQKMMYEATKNDSHKFDLFEYMLSFEKPELDLVQWRDLIPKFVYEPSSSFFDLFVPNKDTICYSHLFELHVPFQHPLYFTGITGSGKTSLLKHCISANKQQISAQVVNFSAKSKAKETQLQIESKMQHQRKMGRGVLMAPPGKLCTLLFIDDVNMPLTELYGAQPPIELLRMILCYKGVFDRTTKDWKDIDSLWMIAAAAPSGGGRSELTPSFYRHFNVFCLPDVDSESKSMIFSSIMEGHLLSKGFRQTIVDLVTKKSPLVNATSLLYSYICEKLLPTPSKSHYLFNLRDLSKVFQGLMQLPNKPGVGVEEWAAMWYYQCQRVFEDRMVDNQERVWFNEKMKTLLSNYFPATSQLTDMMSSPHPLIFAKTRQEPQYRLRDFEKFKNYVQTIMMTETKLSLVLYQEAVLQLAALARVLSLERGNYMFVGVGGSGKKTISQLGATLADCKWVTLQMRKGYSEKEFREDIFGFMKMVAIEGKELCFALSDNQILDESFLESVNNLLNSGEIPGLIKREEMEVITNELSKKKLKTDILTYFVERVRSSLRICLNFSPVGPKLRQRVRQFPSLINCCTINWLRTWPEEALNLVSKLYLGKLELEAPIDTVSNLIVQTHRLIQRSAEEFMQSLGRRVYVTPKNFIEGVQLFEELLRRVSAKEKSKRGNMVTGLAKMGEANKTVDELKIKLSELQPVLIVKKAEQEELGLVLQKETIEVNKVKESVAEQKEFVQINLEHINDSKAEADNILTEAMPLLKSAAQALDQLTNGDIAEIKRNTTPHPIIKFTLECVAILFDERPDAEGVKKMISDTGFMSKLKNYKGESIKKDMQKRIKDKLASNPNFTKEEVGKISRSAQNFCQWIHNMVEYSDVWAEIEIKKSHSEKLSKDLAKATEDLAKKEEELAVISSKFNKLQLSYQANLKEKEKLENEINLCGLRLERAKDLTEGLASEKVRWRDSVQLMEKEAVFIEGNVLLAAMFVNYLGPFTFTYRETVVGEISKAIKAAGVNLASSWELKNVIGNDATIRNWGLMGLPSDSVSINNALVVTTARAYPLLIDPQQQGSAWIKKLQAERGLLVLKMRSEYLTKEVENAVRNNRPVLIEEMRESIEPTLDPLLSRQFVIQGKRKAVKLIEALVEVEDDFMLYLSTKIANPNLMPDIFIKTSVVNFTVTTEGLEEQLLSVVVTKEMPEVEQARLELVVSIAHNRKTLEDCEEAVLRLLTNSKGMILDDVELIENLKLAKSSSEEVKLKLSEAEVKEKQINQAREIYKPVAVQGSLLYFLTSDLTFIDPMYQFSLAYFTKLFKNIIDLTPPQPSQLARISALVDNTTTTVFDNICRGLFNRHKRIFSFLCATRIDIKSGKLTQHALSVFLKGPVPQEPSKSTFNSLKISKQKFNAAFGLGKSVPSLKLFAESLETQTKEWEDWLDSPEPYSLPLPKKLLSVSDFDRVLVVKTLKEQKTIYAMNDYIANSIGERFLLTQAPSMEQIFKDLDERTPLIFVLSPGADPLSAIFKFAKEKGVEGDMLQTISLGQGQGPAAQLAIDTCKLNGGWVILQNCHLGKSFMTTLESKIEELNAQQVSPSFRLFLTSMPCSYFPISVLQNSLKLTNQPPKSIKANLSKIFSEMSKEFYEENKKAKGWKKLAFSLAFFHAIVQERRKFGPLGWKVKYEFNDSDLDSSLTFLQNMLESHAEMPWEALRYIIGEITYGGRVTDEHDRKTLSVVLSRYLTEEVLQPSHSFFQAYAVPDECGLSQLLQCIEQFPSHDSPEVFGMHENANIAFQLNELSTIVDAILLTVPKDTKDGGGKDPDQVVLQLCAYFLERIPQQIKVVSDIFELKNSEGHIDSLQVCLKQQCERFNKLTHVIEFSLAELQKSIRGEVVMNDQLEQLYTSLFDNRTSRTWSKYAYPSLRPLASWYKDYIARVEFFKNWRLLESKPKSYWLSAFFFPQGFLTSVIQNYCRAFKVPINIVSFNFKITGSMEPETTGHVSEHGVLVHGLYSEACRVDPVKGLIEEMQPGIMLYQAPVIQFIPSENYVANSANYLMPVYKTSERAGSLSTTGQSTNFIVSIECPSKKKPEHWISNGAAFICSRKD